jgi:diguanylate cyclase/phosphodiesterase
MLYQPKVCLDSGEIVGYEALIRLKEINVSPAMFIPIAEENNFIISIGRIVTSQVILQMANWRAFGIKLKPVSINFQLFNFRILIILIILLTV